MINVTKLCESILIWESAPRFDLVKKHSWDLFQQCFIQHMLGMVDIS
jgi:hypothetical protein